MRNSLLAAIGRALAQRRPGLAGAGTLVPAGPSVPALALDVAWSPEILCAQAREVLKNYITYN